MRRGFRGIFDALVDYLKLTHLKIELEKSASITRPGECQIMTEIRNNMIVGSKYRIMINDQFLDDPFMIAAILAHELCHVVYVEKNGSFNQIDRIREQIRKNRLGTRTYDRSISFCVPNR